MEEIIYTVEISYLNNYNRANGPAIEWTNGNKYWYLHNNLHRVNGPAIEYANGNKEWYLNGKVHRTNEPAIEFANYKEWCFNGKPYNPKSRIFKVLSNSNCFNIDCFRKEK